MNTNNFVTLKFMNSFDSITLVSFNSLLSDASGHTTIYSKWKMCQYLPKFFSELK